MKYIIQIMKNEKIIFYKELKNMANNNDTWRNFYLFYTNIWINVYKKVNNLYLQNVKNIICLL